MYYITSFKLKAIVAYSCTVNLFLYITLFILSGIYDVSSLYLETDAVESAGKCPVKTVKSAVLFLGMPHCKCNMKKVTKE